ncbi:heme A synthase [Cohnella lubricantis]|uniref:Heme A synthase n=2 Tax=Cohnella lubricantis TaxID=2163172 RepID=A0A841TGD1_9BACL|nr:heme A synthase [Cohnella lubricantis]
MTAQRFRWLTLWTCIGMFLVLVVGVVVTNTESGRGCGTDWPLCNGKFVPAYTLESLVEYTHRAVSGIEGLLVGAVFIWTLLIKPAQKEALIYSSAALLFTVAQALLGAAAVIWPTSDAVLAIHFGISMIAFTFTWLLDSWARRWAANPEAVARGESISAAPQGKTSGAVPTGLFGSVVAILVYCYGVVYIGAYVRHTASAGGCYGWPLCNGELVPKINGATGIAFAHRLAAVVLFIAILALTLWIRKSMAPRELKTLANASLALVVAQILSGWLLTATLDSHDIYVFTSLLHTIIITAMFSLLCLLAIRAKQLSRR